MEFFQCTCPETGKVILDGSDQGFNRDDSGNLLTKQCTLFYCCSHSEY